MGVTCQERSATGPAGAQTPWPFSKAKKKKTYCVLVAPAASWPDGALPGGAGALKAGWWGDHTGLTLFTSIMSTSPESGLPASQPVNSSPGVNFGKFLEISSGLVVIKNLIWEFPSWLSG